MALSRKSTKPVPLHPKCVVCSNYGLANTRWKRCRAGVVAVTQCSPPSVEQAVRKHFFVLARGRCFSDSLRLVNEDRNMSYSRKCHVI